MRVERPQVINGQQTTITINKESPSACSVLVKVIKIPRRPGDDVEYDKPVNSIVPVPLTGRAMSNHLILFRTIMSKPRSRGNGRGSKGLSAHMRK